MSTVFSRPSPRPTSAFASLGWEWPVDLASNEFTDVPPMLPPKPKPKLDHRNTIDRHSSLSDGTKASSVAGVLKNGLMSEQRKKRPFDVADLCFDESSAKKAKGGDGSAKAILGGSLQKQQGYGRPQTPSIRPREAQKNGPSSLATPARMTGVLPHTSTAKKVKVSFLQDDSTSSSDTEDEHEPVALLPAPMAKLMAGGVSAEQKAKQRAESERLRQETTEKQRSQASGSATPVARTSTVQSPAMLTAATRPDVSLLQNSRSRPGTEGTPPELPKTDGGATASLILGSTTTHQSTAAAATSSLSSTVKTESNTQTSARSISQKRAMFLQQSTKPTTHGRDLEDGTQLAKRESFATPQPGRQLLNIPNAETESDTDRQRRAARAKATSAQLRLQDKLKAEEAKFLARVKAEEEAEARKRAEAEAEEKRQEEARQAVREARQAEAKKAEDARRRREVEPKKYHKARIDKIFADNRAKADEARLRKFNEAKPPQEQRHQQQDGLLAQAMLDDCEIGDAFEPTTGKRADEQDRSILQRDPKPILAGGVQEISEAKGQRIQAIKERNERNRQAAERDDGDNADFDPDEPFMLSVETRPTGPVSLNSLAGRNALDRLNASTFQHRPRASSMISLSPELSKQTSEDDNRGSNQRLKEITPDDIKLLTLRDSGLQWPDIYEIAKSNGETRHRDTLRKRAVLIQEAIDANNIEQALLDQVAAGDLQALEQLNILLHTIRKRKSNQFATNRPRDRFGHFTSALQSTERGVAVGEITPEDAQLLSWRDSGMTWEEITSAYEQTHGVSRVHSTHYQRYKLIKAALSDHSVGSGLLDKVAAGDMQARERLNRLVHGTWPVPQARGPGRPVKDAPRVHLSLPRLTTQSPLKRFGLSACPAVSTEVIDDEEPEIHVPPTPSTLSGTSSTLSGTSRTLSGTPSTPRSATLEPRRPTTAGKTINEETLRYYLASLGDDPEDNEGDGDEEREQSPITDEDRCHFAYQVQRREVTADEIADDVDLNDMPWVDVGTAFDSLAQANTQAGRIALCPQDEDTADAVADGSFSLASYKDADGALLMTLTAGDVGSMQVRVERRMRTFQQGILPRCKDCWAPKTVYFVKQRITTFATGSEEQEELFGGGSESVQEYNVEDTVYTTLDLANTTAIAYFVNETFKPNTANLTHRNLAFAAEKKRLADELEGEDEIAMFKDAIEGQGRRVQVWVEAGKLAGPRNM